MVESSIIGSKFTEETDVPLWQEFLMSKLNITVFLVIFFLFNPALAAINTNAEKGVLRTLSAQTYGKAKLNFGAGISFNQSSDYFKGKVKKGSLDSVRLNGRGFQILNWIRHSFFIQYICCNWFTFLLGSVD